MQSHNPEGVFCFFKEHIMASYLNYKKDKEQLQINWAFEMVKKNRYVVRGKDMK